MPEHSERTGPPDVKVTSGSVARQTPEHPLSRARKDASQAALSSAVAIPISGPRRAEWSEAQQPASGNNVSADQQSHTADANPDGAHKPSLPDGDTSKDGKRTAGEAAERAAAVTRDLLSELDIRSRLEVIPSPRIGIDDKLLAPSYHYSQNGEIYGEAIEGGGFMDILGEPFGSGEKVNTIGTVNQLAKAISISDHPEIDSILEEGGPEMIQRLRDAQVLSGMKILDLGSDSFPYFALAAKALGAQVHTVDSKKLDDNLPFQPDSHTVVNLKSPTAVDQIIKNSGGNFTLVTQNDCIPFRGEPTQLWFGDVDEVRAVGEQLVAEDGYYFAMADNLYQKRAVTPEADSHNDAQTQAGAHQPAPPNGDTSKDGKITGPSELVVEESVEHVKGSPFSPDLQLLRYPNFRFSPSLPDKRVRSEIVVGWKINELSREKETLTSADDALAKIKRARDVFTKMQDKEKYGIKIPDMHHVLGYQTKYGAYEVLTFVDEIQGETLTKMKTIPQEEKEKFDKFYQGLANFYSDVFTNGGDYWIDFNPSQAMYGNNVGETENDIYIIDTETQERIVHHNSADIGSASHDHIVANLVQIYIGIKMAEARLPKGTKLTAARQIMAERLKEIGKIAPLPTALTLEVGVEAPAGDRAGADSVFRNNFKELPEPYTMVKTKLIEDIQSGNIDDFYGIADASSVIRVYHGTVESKLAEIAEHGMEAFFEAEDNDPRIFVTASPTRALWHAIDRGPHDSLRGESELDNLTTQGEPILLVLQIDKEWLRSQPESNKQLTIPEWLKEERGITKENDIRYSAFMESFEDEAKQLQQGYETSSFGMSFPTSKIPSNFIFVQSLDGTLIPIKLYLDHYR